MRRSMHRILIAGMRLRKILTLHTRIDLTLHGSPICLSIDVSGDTVRLSSGAIIVKPERGVDEWPVRDAAVTECSITAKTRGGVPNGRGEDVVGVGGDAPIAVSEAGQRWYGYTGWQSGIDVRNSASPAAVLLHEALVHGHVVSMPEQELTL